MKLKKLIFGKIIFLLRLLRGEVPTSILIKRGLRVGTGFSRQGGCRIDPSFCYLIQIGNNVELAPNVTILAHDNSLKRIMGLCKIGQVKIGNNVFVGAGTTILPNVTIGDNIVIGAGSVVCNNLESNRVYAGVPAKCICSITDYRNKNKHNIECGKGIILDRRFSKFNLTEKEKQHVSNTCKNGFAYLQSENYTTFKAE